MDRPRDIVHDHCLGDFERQPGCVEPGLFEGLRDGGDQVLVLELESRQIHTYPERRIETVHCRDVMTGLPEHPSSDGTDDPCRFCHRNELVGAEEASLGMIPTDEGLETPDRDR